MVSPHQVQVGERMHQFKGATDQIIPFHLFLSELEKVRPQQRRQLMQSKDHGQMYPKLPRFRPKVIDVAIIAFQSFHKFFIRQIPILSFTPFCSQKTVTSNFFPLYLIGALITHQNL